MSFERLERLINLAKSWNGPMSVGVSVKDSKKELPIILDAWLNNEHMRRNADIHILFDDQVIISFLSPLLFISLLPLLFLFLVSDC